MMEVWKKIRIGDACVTNADSYSTKEEWKFVNYLDTGNITDNRIDSIQYIDVENDKLPSRARRKVKKNSIVYSTVRPNQRHFGIIKTQPENFLVSTGFAVIDVDADTIDADFFYYLLTQPTLVEALHAIAEQSTSAYPSIKPSDIEDLEIDIPKLATQKKIADVLGSLDRKITQNMEINDNLAQQLRLIFQKMFLDSEHPEWPIDKLGNYLSLERGLSYKGKFLSDSAGVPMVNLGNILPNSVFRPEKLKYYTGDFKAKATVKPGDLVVANTDLTQAREVLGSAIMIPDLGGKVIICSHHISIVRDCKISKHFIQGMLNSPAYRERVIGFATGTTVLALPNETILNCVFAVPPNSLVSEYDSIAESIYQKSEQIRLENQKLANLRDYLLPRLMSGKLDVSALEF